VIANRVYDEQHTIKLKKIIQPRIGIDLIIDRQLSLDDNMRNRFALPLP
jgi:hypothetical protein